MVESDDAWAAYLHGCFSDAIAKLRGETDTPEKLRARTLRLGRLDFQAAMETRDVELAQAKASHKYDFVRYIG